MNNTTNEEQKTPSEISQTLFRFVSLRNPQLADTSEKNRGFVIRPSGIEGVFDTRIESWATQDPKNTTKFQELELAAATFEVQAFKKEKDIELLPSVSDYYKLGKSLAKNEDPDSDIIDRLTTTEALKINNLAMISLWDNLIYQVVTQKDFYVKEAIIQTLKAVHYIDTYKTSEADKLEEKLDLTKTAKVVLPAKLFVEDAPVETGGDVFTVNKTVIGNGDHIAEGSSAARILPVANTRSLSVMQESRLKVEAEKSLQVTNALLKKEMTQSLKKELENLQKSYNKSYNKAYQIAYDDYQIIAKPIIDSNNILLDELETTFDENTTEAEKKAAYEQLQLAEVPKFEFAYKNQINFSDLKAKLIPESFNLFIELFANYDANAISDNIEAEVPQDLQIISDTEIKMYGETVTLSDDYVSYQDIFEKVNEEVSTQSKTVLSTVKMPKQQYVNLGGALVPVAKTSLVDSLSYLLHPFYLRMGLVAFNYLQFSLNVENDSWSVAKARVTGENSNGHSLEQIHLQIPVIDNKVTFPSTFQNKFKKLNNLKIEIYFDNGREAVVELLDIDNVEYLGSLALKSQTDTALGNGMTPKHFGVKRLGIADYLKVEQSVHAYVPGEVSNIENVMASELRHKSSVTRDYSEITDTTSKSQETEQISDTTKTTRTDMQTEVARELEKQQSWEAHTSFGKSGKWYFEVGGSYANSTAQHDSTRQAVAKSQEITERAMERVLTKVSEERIQKIIKEYTETNVHEFDNRGQAASALNANPSKPQHITGVYRWVDKKMKNQIYNYGKRTMFEFMIPEPARLHKLALGSNKNVLTAPQDPRNPLEDKWKMKDSNVDESIIEHWAKEYKIEYTPSLPLQITKPDNRHCTKDESNDEKFDVPENYVCKNIHIDYRYEEQRKSGFLRFDTFDGNTMTLYDHKGAFDFGNLNFVNEFHLYFYQNWLYYSNLAVTQSCDLSNDYITNRKNDYFKKIIDAYTQAKAAFEKAQADAEAQAIKDEAENKEKVSAYYRDMESEVLKHNCIAYLLQDIGGYGAVGKDLTNGAQTMSDFAVRFKDDLDAYTSLAKFMEQAMEWSVMDYTFYPYYWGNSANWQEMYLSSDLDPLFRNFLQAGMARVIVTVKPGFEDAVNFFMTTGRIWNGGEVPVIGDPMYLSIVEELRQPTGKKQGNYWITRVPTALTILQAGSVGLTVDDALPIFKEDHPEECENPLELETASAFGKPVDIRLEGSNLPTTLPNTIVRPI